MTKFAADRINGIVERIGAKTYLEIGVYEGATFLEVDIAKKVAVDPNLRFHWQSLASPVHVFEETSSDDYFLNRHDGTTFDVVFLDGLHTFEQTFRDFCNSLCVSNQTTVWIIDDTLPSDVYSTLTDHAAAMAFRSATGNQDRSWHGDVFKLIFAIHDFFPMLSFGTVKSPGNPQTIVWKRPRSTFKPAYNDLERISRMTYFDLMANIERMNITSDQEIVNQLPRRSSAQ